MLGQGEPGPPATARDLAAVEALLPAAAGRGRPVQRRADGARRAGVHGPGAALPAVPAGRAVRVAAGRRARRTPGRARGRSASPAPTARSAAGCWTCCAAAPGPVPKPALDLAWPADVQRERALDSLVADGLVDPLPDGRYALPG